MSVNEVIWWSYTIFVALVVLFMIIFARKVRGKGD